MSFLRGLVALTLSLRRVSTLLASVLSVTACVRRPPPITISHSPAADGASPDSNQADGIVAVGLHEGTAFGQTASGRIRAWDIEQSTVRTLGPARFTALATDGTVALATTDFGEHGKIVEAWDLSSNRPLQTSRFEDGAYVLAVSATFALIDVDYPPPGPCVGCGAAQVLPPRSHTVLWSFGSGQLEDEAGSVCRYGALVSAVDARVACATSGGGWVSLFDRGRRTRAYAPELAPEWRTTPRRDGKLGPVSDPWIDLLSVRPAEGGDDVYLAYHGKADHPEWRLERWTTDWIGWGYGTVERLAVARAELSTMVLAASAGGKVIVLGGQRLRPTVRRAPGYLAETIPIDSANAAAISADGERIVTGHDDGRMRLWDARTLQLLASSQ